MSNRKPNHHEIPQFYLKGFSDSGTSYIWLFERGRFFDPGKKRGKNNPALLGISQIGHRPDGYAICIPGKKTDYSYEAKLMKEEQKANLALSKVRDQIEITLADKQAIAEYITLMAMRLTRRDQAAGPIVNPVVEDDQYDTLSRRLALGGRVDLALQVPKSKQFFYSNHGRTTLLRKSMFERQWVTHTLSLMTWSFLVAPKGEFFVTSDNPTVYDESADLLRSPLLFPINHEVMLFGDWSTNEDWSYKTISANKTRLLNTAVIRCATKEVYSPKSDRWIHDVMKSVPS